MKMKNERLKVKRENGGITLISLIITIIILLILAGVTINVLIGNTGIFNISKQAVEETNKSQATETMNLKITNIQISSYAETQKLPNLQYLADKLCEDNDMEYVLTKSNSYASLNKIDVTNFSSIYTKLKDYPYEFEINSSLQLASIDGVKIADNTTVTKSEYDTLLQRVVALENQHIGTIYDSTEVSRTYSLATWATLKSITLDPGTYIIQLQFDAGPTQYTGEGNTFIELTIQNAGVIGSNGTYTKGQWIRNNSLYIVSPTTTTTYNMNIWSDYKASSDLSQIRNLEMKAIRLK